MPVLRRLPIEHARVLIVEDETGLRKLLAQATSGWGFHVESAWSGEEALKLNAVQPFDLAILDYHLPRLNGIDTLHRLREQAPSLQAIVLTGFGSVEVVRQALHLEVVEFLTKPCTKGDLERAMDRALGRRFVAPETDPQDLESPPLEFRPGATLAEVERVHILATLLRNEGNRAAAARELGVTRRTLFNKLKLYKQQGLMSE